MPVPLSGAAQEALLKSQTPPAHKNIFLLFQVVIPSSDLSDVQVTTTGNPTFLTLIRVWISVQHRLHTNQWELPAVFQALNFLCPVLGQHVLVRIENSTVVCYTNAQTGARTPSLLNLSQSLLSWFSVHFLSPRATHAGAGLSLQAGTPEGGMNITPFTSGQLWDLFVEAKVDLFASRVKTYCPHSSLQLTTTQPFPSEDSGQGATNLLRYRVLTFGLCLTHSVSTVCWGSHKAWLRQGVLI